MGASRTNTCAAREDCLDWHYDRKPKRHPGANPLAKFIAAIPTPDNEPVHEPDATAQRKGEEKGGPAPALDLTPEKRSEIAKLAAAA